MPRAKIKLWITKVLEKPWFRRFPLSRPPTSPRDPCPSIPFRQFPPLPFFLPPRQLFYHLHQLHRPTGGREGGEKEGEGILTKNIKSAAYQKTPMLISNSSGFHILARTSEPFLLDKKIAIVFSFDHHHFRFRSTNLNSKEKQNSVRFCKLAAWTSHICETSVSDRASRESIHSIWQVC